MKTKSTFLSFTISASLLALTACNKEVKQTDVVSDEAKASLLAAKNNAAKPEGYIYTMSNETTQNSILCFGQQANGTLTYMSTALSGGTGSGAGLGSQGSIAIDKNNKWLYAVNAGSNSISSFRIQEDGSLKLAHTVSSNGTLPISVTVYNNLLYVVNTTTSNISGYTISSGGEMTHIQASNKSLSSANAGPAQISFNHYGDKLVVTEKNNNKISTYSLNTAGKPGQISSYNSAGQTPFGFAFSGNCIVVSEASGGMPMASTVSSYKVEGPTSLTKGPIATNQTSACWTAVSADGRNAYVTNTMSNTISSFAINSVGSIRLMDAAEVATGTTPIDITYSGNDYFVYNINSGSHNITEYKRTNNESLKKIGELTGLPAHAVGIAAF